LNEPFLNTGFKKKLHTLNPHKKELQIEIQKTKRRTINIKINPDSCQNLVREQLACKVSGTMMGLWLLIPEHLKLGTWDMLKHYSNTQCDNDLEPRFAMQMVHEAALCVQGIRAQRNIAHQGFDILNGLPEIISDNQSHYYLNDKTIHDSQQLQIMLGQLRAASDHFPSKIISIDPHRILTATQRIMPKKKKRPNQPSEKMLQTYFALDPISGQPIASTIGSTGKKTSHATIELLQLIQQIQNDDKLILADAEHFTINIVDYIKNQTTYDFLSPTPVTAKITKLMSGLDYTPQWAGFATAITEYQFKQSKEKYHLLVQRTGEANYQYKPFITSNPDHVLQKLSEYYPLRWSIEEFFNFEGSMGWKRASTLNLNIRYGKQSLALIAQALVSQFREKLPKAYINWTAQSIADKVFSRFDADIKVKKNTIFVTYYGIPEEYGFKNHYSNMPQKLENENIDPRIPWLYDFKVDYIFK